MELAGILGVSSVWIGDKVAFLHFFRRLCPSVNFSDCDAVISRDFFLLDYYDDNTSLFDDTDEMTI